MKYEVIVTQVNERTFMDGKTYNDVNDLCLTFKNFDDIQMFLSLALLNGENISAEIKFIKEKKNNELEF